MKLLSGLFLFVVAVTSLQAEVAGDLKGSKDDPSIKRYANTFIWRFQDKDYDSYTLPQGKALSPNAKTPERFENVKNLEGRVTRRVYMSTEADRSSLEVFRNYQQELKAAGFEPLFDTAGKSEKFMPLDYLSGDFTHGVQSPSESSYYQASVKKAADGSEQYASVWVGAASPYRPSWAPNKSPFVVLDLITVKGMDARMTLVKADEMERKIGADGSIALYGIYFDFNKDEIKPESAPTLEQIAKLLSDQPALKLYVVGHTDNVGSLDFNRDLSDRRAKSVVRSLVQQYGVASARLAGAGVAFLAPIASNATEEGRSKNRRVVLVPQEK